MNDPTSIAYHTRKIRRLFILCSILFCTDDRCSLPLHTLLTYVIDSQGGTALLIKLLNRLGICSSIDTLSRFIQHKMTSTESPRVCCQGADSFSLASVDNIDFMHVYSKKLEESHHLIDNPSPTLDSSSNLLETSCLQHSRTKHT